MAESGNPYWCQGQSSGSAVACTSYGVPGAAMNCALPSASTHHPGVPEWSEEEQATLERGLVEHDGYPPFRCYLNISRGLPNKTMREVALRRQWMESIQIPSTEMMDVMQEVSLDETVLPGKELAQNKQIFAQVSSNHASFQIHENVQLLAIARDNINKILDCSNKVTKLWERMAPMPVINENLLNFILRK